MTEYLKNSHIKTIRFVKFYYMITRFIYASAGDLQVHALVSPNRVGVNQFTLHLSHNDNTPIGDVQRVRLTFDRIAGSLGPSSADMTAQNPNAWNLQGPYLNQPGEWTMAVYVRRRGLDDATAVLTMTVP